MDLLQGQVALLVERLIVIAFIVVIALIVVRVGRALIHRSLARVAARADNETPVAERDEVRKRMATIETLARSILQAFVVIVAGLMILSRLGIDVAPALAGLGIAGIAIGFGAQAIVRDYFSGLLILVENQYGKGDVVTIAGVTGVVEEYTLRRTVLRDVDGIVHNVPNGEIKVASNRTRLWRRINLDIVIAFGQDVDRAIAVLDEAGQELAADRAWSERILEVPRVDRVERLGEAGVTLKVLGTVRAADELAVASELRKRLYAAMIANGLQPPGAVVAAPGAPGGAGPAA